jgi:hypothetical protein
VRVLLKEEKKSYFFKEKKTKLNRYESAKGTSGHDWQDDIVWLEKKSRTTFFFELKAERLACHIPVGGCNDTVYTLIIANKYNLSFYLSLYIYTLIVVNSLYLY